MYNKIIVFVSGMFFISCLKVNCDKSIILSRNQECLIVVEKFSPNNQSYLNAKGKSLINGDDCICTDTNRWWFQYRDQIEIGDTLIKKKGELTFSIHKSDTVLSYQWICEGKEYF